MRKPLSPGMPIDAKRYKKWVDRFGSYRAGIINLTIESWLDQFKEADKDLAARVLDSVEYYGQSQICAAYQEALNALPGWNPLATKRKGKWAFSAMSRSAGESGDAMLHQFRIANKLSASKYDGLFMQRSDLFRLPHLAENDPGRFGQDDVVVLLDDFSGTGSQVCDAWNNPQTSFGALLAGVGTVYLVVIAASKAAMTRIKAETSIELVPAHQLTESDNIFAEKCQHFNKHDRARLLHYGSIAARSMPMGFGDCGFVVVFQHRTPNNSIPILHADHDAWTGLFPRH